MLHLCNNSSYQDCTANSYCTTAPQVARSWKEQILWHASQHFDINLKIHGVLYFNGKEVKCGLMDIIHTN